MLEMSRTVIDVDDDLIQGARELTGLKKKVDVINKALEEFVRLPAERIRWIMRSRNRRKGYLERGLQ